MTKRIYVVHDIERVPELFPVRTGASWEGRFVRVRLAPSPGKTEDRCDLLLRLTARGPSPALDPERIEAERAAWRELVDDADPIVRRSARRNLAELTRPAPDPDDLAGHRFELTFGDESRTETTDERGEARFADVPWDATVRLEPLPERVVGTASRRCRGELPCRADEPTFAAHLPGCRLLAGTAPAPDEVRSTTVSVYIPYEELVYRHLDYPEDPWRTYPGVDRLEDALFPPDGDRNRRVPLRGRLREGRPLLRAEVRLGEREPEILSAEAVADRLGDHSLRNRDLVRLSFRPCDLRRGRPSEPGAILVPVSAGDDADPHLIPASPAAGEPYARARRCRDGVPGSAFVLLPPVPANQPGIGISIVRRWGDAFGCAVGGGDPGADPLRGHLEKILASPDPDARADSLLALLSAPEGGCMSLRGVRPESLILAARDAIESRERDWLRQAVVALLDRPEVQFDATVLSSLFALVAQLRILAAGEQLRSILRVEMRDTGWDGRSQQFWAERAAIYLGRERDFREALVRGIASPESAHQCYVALARTSWQDAQDLLPDYTRSVLARTDDSREEKIALFRQAVAEVTARHDRGRTELVRCLSGEPSLEDLAADACPPSGRVVGRNPELGVTRYEVSR